MRYLLLSLLSCLALSACQPGTDAPVQTTTAEAVKTPAASAEKLQVKAVVVAMFEIGEDEGDRPGEFQFWKERYGLTEKYPFPHGFHDLYYNPEKGVLGMVTGMGIARASSAFTALGLDPRFDLTKAYWLIAGIAGIDPQDGSIGSGRITWSTATWRIRLMPVKSRQTGQPVTSHFLPTNLIQSRKVKSLPVTVKSFS